MSDGENGAAQENPNTMPPPDAPVDPIVVEPVPVVEPEPAPVVDEPEESMEDVARRRVATMHPQDRLIFREMLRRELLALLDSHPKEESAQPAVVRDLRAALGEIDTPEV